MLSVKTSSRTGSHKKRRVRFDPNIDVPSPNHTANRSNTGDVSEVEINNEVGTDKAEFSDDELYYLKIALARIRKPNILIRPWCYLLRELIHFIGSYELVIKTSKKETQPGQHEADSKNLKRNLYGLICGILVGYICFFLFLFTFSHSPYISTLVSCYLMLICVFGFSFSATFRCTALLVIPYVAASRIRWLFLMLATTLAITGPGLNFLHNSGNFRNSITCVLSQIDTNMQLIKKLTASPFELMGGRIKNLIDNINQAIAKIRNSLSSIHLALFKITNVMDRQSSWIKSLAMACGDAVALRNQCLAFFNNVYFNCKASLRLISGLCTLVRHFADDACSKNMDQLVQQCKRRSEALQDSLDEPLSANVSAQMDNILDTLGRDDMQVSESTDNKGKLKLGGDSSINTIVKNRIHAMASKIRGLKVIIAWILVVWTLITMFLLVLQAVVFKRLWLSSDLFDNFYITGEFIKQESRAVIRGLVPTVPLSRKERKLYKRLDSIRWTKSEKTKAFQSVLVIFLWMLSIIMVMATDYAMHYLVVTVTPLYDVDLTQANEDGRAGQDYEASASEPVQTEVITSDSSMSSIVKSMMGMINPLKDIAMNLDISACKPSASEPDANTNKWIFVLLGSTIFSLFFQIYVMRLRHVIMIWYYPDRAAQRAAWLRTYIRNNRGLMHRLIHKFKTSELDTKRQAAKVSMFGKCLIRNPRIRMIFEKLGIKRVTCEFCGEEGNPNKKAQFELNFIQCPECGKYYCKACQTDLDHICMLCRTPLSAMEMEIDFEQNSSDEQYEAMCNRYLRRAEQATNLVNRVIDQPEKVEMDRPKVE